MEAAPDAAPEAALAAEPAVEPTAEPAVEPTAEPAVESTAEPTTEALAWPPASEEALRSLAPVAPPRRSPQVAVGATGPPTLWRTREPDAAELAALRERSCSKGSCDKRARLVVALPRGTSSAPLARRLLEGGWCVLHEPAAGDPRPVVVARPAEVTVRALRADDADSVLELFVPSFLVRRELPHWRWKYLEHPWGSLHGSLAFDHEGRLLAQYAGYPTRFWEQQDGERRIHPAIQIGDLMSARRARQRGRGATSVFGRCQRHFFATFAEDRMGFLYGFNTATSRAFAMRYAAGREVEAVPLWRAEIDRLQIAAPTVPYRVETSWRSGRELDRFFRRVAGDYGRLAVRSAGYLAWRYARPDRRYVLFAVRRWTRLVGWAVFARQEDRLLWGDALFDRFHPGAIDAVLRAAIRHPELQGAAWLEGWFPPRPAWWRDHLLRLGLERVTHPDDLTLICRAEGHPHPEELLGASYYTMGDGDLF